MDFQITISLGSLLAACLVASLIADRLRLPKVTAYLLVGLAIGPGSLNWIPHEHVEMLQPVTKLAMALVLFNLGCHFPLDYMRKLLRRITYLSLSEMGFTFALVGLGLLLFVPWEVALLLAALALATAPATTVLVLKEASSEGQVTEYASALVALNNLFAIVAFEVIFLGIQLADGRLTAPLPAELLLLTRNIVGSTLLGVLTGLLVSFGCGLLNQNRWLVLLVATSTFMLGFCEMFNIPYMLTFLMTGLTVVNSSDLSAKIVAELEKLTGLLCVLFFAIHGTELDIRAFLAAGTIGAAYIICRSCGKYLGAYVGARAIGESHKVRVWLGPTLLAQAGAAIALCSIAVNRDPELGKSVQVVILGSVVFFEIVGPILIRQSVMRAGEVPLAQAIYHTTDTPVSQGAAIWNRLRISFGWHPVNRQSPGELLVSDLLRKNVAGIPETATFDQVIHYIEHSHDNTYPVVDKDSTLIGVIRYPSLSSALFDRNVGTLVRAEDLATPVNALLHPEDPASRALDLLNKDIDDCIPVVSREKPHTLLGVVRKNDIVNLLIRGHRG